MHEPNAMVVATVSADGQPSSRMVLLKGIDERGFHFYTNRASAKGADLAGNPRCALLFPWHPLERQVRITGVAWDLPEADVNAYFATRPRGSRLGAWASHQSSEVASRDELATAYDEVSARFADDEVVPVPPMWGGYAVHPEAVEFWQGRPGRMHDRLRLPAYSRRHRLEHPPPRPVARGSPGQFCRFQRRQRRKCPGLPRKSVVSERSLT